MERSYVLNPLTGATVWILTLVYGDVNPINLSFILLYPYIYLELLGLSSFFLLVVIVDDGKQSNYKGKQEHSNWERQNDF